MSLSRLDVLQGYFLDADNRLISAAKENPQRDAMEVKYFDHPEVPQNVGTIVLAGSQVELQ